MLKTDEKLSCKGFDVKKYIDLVTSGSFYEFIQAHFEPLYPTRFDTRAKVKKEVLRIFFSDPNVHSLLFYKPAQTFKELFPTVYELFKLIQQSGKNYLPIILQRIESYLMLDVVCKSISKLHPEIPLFTIHDNIITTKGNEDIVEDILLKEIENWLGYKPSIGREDLSIKNVA